MNFEHHQEDIVTYKHPLVIDKDILFTILYRHLYGGEESYRSTLTYKRAPRAIRRHRNGIYQVKYPSVMEGHGKDPSYTPGAPLLPTKDPSGFTIIHWPTLVWWLYRGPGYPLLEKLSPYAFDLQPEPPLKEKDQMYYIAQAAKLDLEKALPIASLVQSNSEAFMDLLQIHEMENIEETEFSVIRAPFITSTYFKTLEGNLRYHEKLDEVPFMDKEVYDQLPPLLQLFVVSWIECLASEDRAAHHKWGFTWTTKGLAFNVARALSQWKRIWPSLSRDNPRYTLGQDLYPVDYSTFVSQSVDLMSLDLVHVKLKGRPKLTQIVKPADKYSDDVLEELEVMNYMQEDWDLLKNSMEWNNSYAVVFNTDPSNSNSLPRLIEKWSRSKPEDVRLTSKEAASTPQRGPRKKKKKSKLTRKILTTDVSTELLSYEGTEEPMPSLTLDFIKKTSGYFIAYPPELVDLCPEIDNVNNFRDRGYKAKDYGVVFSTLGVKDTQRVIYNHKFKEYVKHTSLPLPTQAQVDKKEDCVHRVIVNRINLGKGVPHYTSIEGRVFLHPALLSPGKEAWTILETAFKAYGLTYDKNKKALLDCFHILLQWIADPSGPIERGELGYELEVLTNPEINKMAKCRLFLSTPEERIKYLVDKGQRQNEQHIALYPEMVQKGRRSRKMNSYDYFALWNGEHEIAQFAQGNTPSGEPFRLNYTQAAEYISKRWLPWRTPQSLAGKIDLPIRDPEFRMTPEYTGSIDQLINDANDRIGPAAHVIV